MSQDATFALIRRRFSLSTYLSLLLALAAIIPLVVTIGSILILLRPALIAQQSSTMKRNAQTRIQLIDTYLSERLNDVKTLSESAPIDSFLSGDQNSQVQANDALVTTIHRDIADYISLSLLNTRGNLILAYPTTPQTHGNYLIPPDILQQLPKAEKVLISDVFFDPVANTASIDFYAPVFNATFQLIGVVRASLGLHRVWQPVDSEPQNSGTGSYAFILDEHGVRIGYTNPDHSGFTHPKYLFKAVASLSAAFLQQVKSENIYGNSTTPVSTIADPTLASIQNGTQSSAIFQLDPTGQSQTYEAARYTSTVVPWTYYILTPLSTVTGAADQQLLSIILIITLMLFLAIFVGLQVGRRITSPILRSVSSLRENSLALKTLADEERVVATEQSWMIEASQVALHSVKYYTNAAGIAMRRLTAIGTELAQNPQRYDERALQQALREMLEAATYMQRVIEHQEVVNEKLTTSIRVTTQATEQLTNGAESTDAAASQLETIVNQLTTVVEGHSRELSQRR